MRGHVSIPHWFDSASIRFFESNLLVAVSIPHWFDSAVVQGLVNRRNKEVSIPHWFDSAAVFNASCVSNPHWFDSAAGLPVGRIPVLTSFNPTLVRFSTDGVVRDQE